jgi:hypothetical protein
MQPLGERPADRRDPEVRGEARSCAFQATAMGVPRRSPAIVKQLASLHAHEDHVNDRLDRTRDLLRSGGLEWANQSDGNVRPSAQRPGGHLTHANQKLGLWGTHVRGTFDRTFDTAQSNAARRSRRGSPMTGAVPPS